MKKGYQLNSEMFQVGLDFLETFAKVPLVETKRSLRNFYERRGITFSDFEWNVEFGVLAMGVRHRRLEQAQSKRSLA
jgi:hypothetical protein